MSKELTKSRPLCSRKESLLSRSCPPDETNVLNKSVQNDILCVEVSDDSEHEVDTAPRISIQLRHSTDENPVEKELLKKFNSEFMNESRRGSSRNSSDFSPTKKPKVSNEQSPNKDQLPSSSESDQDEVIELESLSSHNRNTRLKSTETSSEIRVSSSSKSTPPRPRLKNTLPTGSFERYLSGISKKYRELTHRDRVLLWEFSSEVSDVEDYVQFEEKLHKYKTTKKYTNTRKTQIDNNNGEASCSTRNNCNANNILVNNKVPSKEALSITCSNTVDVESSSSVEEATKEDILMSINTKTMEVYQHNPILLDSDESKKTGSSLNLLWSDEDSVFKKNRLNPEIDKISRIIQSNILNRGKEEISGKHELNHHEHHQENFKIPTVPRKYLPSKMDSYQKEEFYKYLGLGTKSPNGKCEDDHEHTDNKRRSLRVRRLLMQQCPTSSNEDKKDEQDNNEQAEDEVSPQKLAKTSPIEPATIDGMECKVDPEEEIDEKPVKPLTISKARRTCGPVVKSICPTNQLEVKDRSVSPKLIQQDQSILNTSKNSESVGDVESESSTNTMVLMRHSYEKSGPNPREEGGSLQPFCRDMTEKNEQNYSMRLRNGIKPLKNKKRNRKRSKITSNTLFSESKINNTASLMYNKFKEFKESLKESTGAKASSILMKFEYNDNNSQITKNAEGVQIGSPTTLDFILNSNSSTTCPVLTEKNEINNRAGIEQITSMKKPFRRAVIRKRKSHKLWAKSQRVKLLRSSVLNQRILRNRKFVIITTKTLNKKSRPCIVRKRKRTTSEKSTNLLSPARVAKMDKADENVVVKAPELEVQKIEISQDKKKTATIEERTVTKVEYASPNLLPNPLNSEKGAVLHAFYVQDLLIVVQEFFINFWKYSKVVQMLGKSQEWEQLGECKRNLNDSEVSAPYKNRLCLNETNPIYLEMRARQLPNDLARECNLASVYVNVYYFDDWKASTLTYSVQLDTIRGLATDVTYTTITNSRYFVMCWKQESVLGTNRTGLCKYALTPDLDTLASIREFKHMRHIIHHLECINDDKLIGFGETQVTIWDHRTGDVLTNFDLEISLGRNVGSVLSSIQFKSYLFLYQTRCIENSETPELKILAITLSASTPSFRLIYTHELPPSFTSIKSSICTEAYVITTSAIGEEFMLLPHQPHRLYYFNPSLATTLMRFHSSGSENFVEISNETLVIKTIDEYLMNFMR